MMISVSIIQALCVVGTCVLVCMQAMVWYIVLITYSITYARMRYLVSILMDPLQIPSFENKYLCIFAEVPTFFPL